MIKLGLFKYIKSGYNIIDISSYAIFIPYVILRVVRQ